MVHTIYLLSKTLEDREHFIEQTLNNQRWTLPASATIVTDRRMVELAQNLHGWTKSVYEFGCAFIHLSAMADYAASNPFEQLSAAEVDDIKQHLSRYHDFPMSTSLSMDSIQSYLPKVLDKVSGNLECYIESLESNEVINVQNI